MSLEYEVGESPRSLITRGVRENIPTYLRGKLIRQSQSRHYHPRDALRVEEVKMITGFFEGELFPLCASVYPQLNRTKIARLFNNVVCNPLE